MSNQDEKQNRMPEEGGLTIHEPNTEEILPPRNLEQDILIRLGLAREPQSQLLSMTTEQLSDRLLSTQRWQERVRIVECLGECKEKVQVENIIIDRLHTDPSEGVRMAAIRALGKLWQSGGMRLGPFLDGLSDKHPWVRATTVQVLASLKRDLTRQLIDLLKKRLMEKKEDEVVHIAIIHLLSVWGSDDLVQVLLQVLQDRGRSALVREVAIIALGSLHKDIAPQPLSQALYDDDRFVREAAIGALKLKVPITDLLGDLDKDANVAAKAARVLGELGRHSQFIEDALRRAATDANKHSAVRVAALLALAQLGTAIDEKTLALLQHIDDEDIRSAAEILADVLQQYELSRPRVGTLMYPFKKHQAYVTSVVWSPAGKLVASGDSSGIVYVWEALTGKIYARFTQNAPITALSWGPDGETIASVDIKGQMFLWQAKTGKRLTMKDASTSGLKGGETKAMVWSNVKHLGVNAGGQVYIFDTPLSYGFGNADAPAFNAHAGNVNALSFSPDGLQVVAGYADGRAIVWGAESNKRGHSTYGTYMHMQAVRAVSWASSGEWIASGGDDTTVQVWRATKKDDADIGDPVYPFTGHSNVVNTIAFAHDSWRVASAGKDKTVLIFDLDGNDRGAFTGHTASINSLAWSPYPRDKYIATSSDDKTVCIWLATEN